MKKEEKKLENNEKRIVKAKEIVIKKNKPYRFWYKEENVRLTKANCNDVWYLRFPFAEQFPWLDLSFSTRLGGISKGYLESMNLGWNRGEPRENVCENYRRYCEALHLDYKKIVLSDQVHDKKVLWVSHAECGGEKIEKKLKEVDGLLTEEKGLVLANSFADCVPLFFWDSVQKIIAEVHSGWKGTVLKIGEETINKMLEHGSRLQDIYVIIGPSICQECYEVSQDVADAFLHAYGEEACQSILELHKDSSGKVICGENGDKKYMLDLWAANWLQLKKAGILPEHICVSGVCTCCNSKLLFSHRATGGKRGNMNGFFMIKH